jgi:hypothetical protein
MRSRSRFGALAVSVPLALAAASTATASEASCAGQFTSVGAQDVVPFGQLIVAPEAQDPTLGGSNLGLEVKDLFAEADRAACPIPPP